MLYLRTMLTQLAYILVCGTEGYYFEQALVSASSARRTNPAARMVLLTDTATDAALSARGGRAEEFRRLFDRIIPIELDPSLPAMKRSRLLKTGMRSFLEGDFLYIDTDTLIERPLDPIDAVPGPLAAVADLHCRFPDHPHRTATINLCRRADFDASGEEVYFNSGVMLVRDCPQAHEFFRLWREYYLKGYEQGLRQDQPTLAQANASMGHPMQELPGFWNCQLQHGVRFLRDAYVVHYVCTNITSGEERKLFALNDPDVLQSVRVEGVSAVEEILSDPFAGLAACSQLCAGEDLHFFRTRRYRAMRARYRRDRFSLLEFLLKVRDHLKHPKP